MIMNEKLEKASTSKNWWSAPTTRRYFVSRKYEIRMSQRTSLSSYGDNVHHLVLTEKGSVLFFVYFAMVCMRACWRGS